MENTCLHATFAQLQSDGDFLLVAHPVEQRCSDPHPELQESIPARLNKLLTKQLLLLFWKQINDSNLF